MILGDVFAPLWICTWPFFSLLLSVLYQSPLIRINSPSSRSLLTTFADFVLSALFPFPLAFCLNLTEACLSHCLSLLQPYLLPTHFTHLTHSFCSHSSSSPDTPPTPFPLLQSHLLSLLPSIPSAADASSSTALSAAKSQASAAALKKTNSSQGVKKLKSVNTKGMADLRGFFGKKTTAEK